MRMHLHVSARRLFAPPNVFEAEQRVRATGVENVHVGLVGSHERAGPVPTAVEPDHEAETLLPTDADRDSLENFVLPYRRDPDLGTHVDRVKTRGVLAEDTPRQGSQLVSEIRR